MSGYIPIRGSWGAECGLYAFFMLPSVWLVGEVRSSQGWVLATLRG